MFKNSIADTIMIIMIIIIITLIIIKSTAFQYQRVIAVNIIIFLVNTIFYVSILQKRDLN